jgi:Zn-dependent protease
MLLTIVVFLSILIISVALHEMMHAFVAHRLGDDLAYSQGRISLNPFRHIDPVLTVAMPLVLLLFGLPPILAAKPVPINTNRVSGDELGLAVIGLAGPFTNLVLATIASFVYPFLGGGLPQDIGRLFIELNVGLFVFNMLPIPPLDGSRLLYAFSPRPVQRVMEQIEQFGIFAVVIIISVALPVLSPVLETVQSFILQILL